MTITQQSASATLNWQSFNIAAGNTVTFNQPSASATALNQIFQASPSQIFGALKANGRIYLLNQNGILFGAGAQVNVGTLLASSLSLSPDAATNGLAQAGQDGVPALQPYTDAQGNALPSGSVTINPGANITAAGGQVLIFAPEVVNRGTISSPDGQTILGAGQRVFLVTSTDPNVRGLLVEVGLGGTVTNGEAANAGRAAADLVGVINADHGNVTLAGLAVNQLGRVSATTSTVANGSILLQASDAGSSTNLPEPGFVTATESGTLTVGPGSVTEVLLDTAGTDKAVSSTAQPQSLVNLTGSTISIGQSARITATAGDVSAIASTNPAATSTAVLTQTVDSSRLVIAPDAVIDVSGATISLPVSDNVIPVQLRGTELADSPLQRNGPLQGQTVYIDIRQSGTNADGTVWQGTPLANVSGYINALQYGVAERSLAAGTITLGSQGGLVVEPGAVLNVSGGQINWQGGYVNTTKLLATNGQEYDISAANPNLSYVGVVGSSTVSDPHWGVTQNLPSPGAPSLGQFQPGYVQGASAGTVQLVAPQMIMDGNLSGQTVTGPLQRLPAKTITSAVPPPDQAPLGATLELGIAGSGSLPDSVEGDINIGGGLVLPGLQGAGGTAFNPLTDPWPSALASIRVRADLLGPEAASNLIVFSNRTVDITAGTPLTLPSGATVEINANDILVSSSIDTPAGSITLSARPSAAIGAPAPQITLSPGVSLLAQGEWVNDLLANLRNDAVAPLYTSGGRISLSATNGNLVLGAGSILDVSAGAQLTASGSTVAGAAGAIALADSTQNPSTPVSLELAGAQLRGYGLTQGGSLSLSANSVCISAAQCGPDTSVGQLHLAPGFFSQGGFASYSVASNLGGLEIGSDSTITLQQSNLFLLGSAVQAPSGTPMAAITTTKVLPDDLRQASSLSLSALNSGTEVAELPNLMLDGGASIVADPRSSITFRGDSLIILNGLISAPGGSVSMLLDNSQRESSFQPNQAIWLGPSATIDVSGTLIAAPPSTPGLVVGNVLAGGSVSIDAQRGYIVDLQGATINASGTAAPVDVGYGNTTETLEPVASAGGSIALQAAEGMFIDGSLVARSGNPATVAGGSLSVVMDATNRKDTAGGTFPDGPREILLSNSSAPVIVAPGAPIPLSYDGVARLPLATVKAGGFDSVTLQARNAFYVDENGNVNLVGYGEIAVDPGVTLTPRGQLILNAAQIAVTGPGSATLGSAYVLVGSSDLASQNAPAATDGPGSLTVNGQFVDLLGHTSFTGISTVSINSSGDIRLRGVFPQSGVDTGYLGELDVAAALHLNAQQIYPSTLTNYTVAISDGAANGLYVGNEPGVAAPVLSAGAMLTVDAPSISVAGTLRVPNGNLTLNAPNIDVLSGGTLSTASGAPLTLFGSTQGGTYWSYPVENGYTNIYGTGGQPLPSKSISLNGASVRIEKGGVVDVSGGGDLLAYEFVPGPGGTQDVLSPTIQPNLYAIVPSLGLAFAPYDPNEDRNFTLPPGTSVYLAGAPSLGLAAGTYALLPARYALLPGAFLVSPVSGYQDIGLNQGVAQLNGSVVVAGYEVMTGAGYLSGRTGGFDVLPGSDALNLAQYTETTANAFFTAQAAASAASPTRLPQDAGIVSIAAQNTLVLAGQLLGTKTAAGLGAELDISAPKILVTGGSDSGPAGFLPIPAGQLSGFGADTVVLGGTRESTSEGSALLASASVVEVASGATLTAPEIELLGLDAVNVDSGAQVKATGAPVSGSGTLLLDGGATLLRVSTGPQVTVTRINDSTSGSLSIGDSAVIGASGSVTVDLLGTATAAGTFAVPGGSLSIGAPTIEVGNPSAVASGFTLDPTRISALNLGELVLNGSQSIELNGAFTLTTKALTLNTPVVVSGGASTAAEFTVDQLTVGGPQGIVAVAPAVSGGSVQFSARTAALLGGDIGFNGFATTTLAVAGPLQANNGGTLTTSGDLQLGASVIAAASGQDSDFAAGGNIGISTLAAAAGSAAPNSSLGGALRFTAAGGITDSGYLLAPAGIVQLVATGAAGISEGSTARTDVSGRVVSSNGLSIGAPGGLVSLEADSGGINVASGADINVSASSAAAGILQLLAPNGAVTFAGTLHGTGVSMDQGGNVQLLASGFDFGSLRSALTAAGFTGSWDLHMMGLGDLVLPAGDKITASAISLTADQGAITIGGAVDATSPQGGSVTLAAQGPITVSGTIDARGTNVGVRGGDVLLESSTGVALTAGSLLSVGGNGVADPALAPGGTVTIQIPQSAVLSVVANSAPTSQLSLAGTVQGARQVSVVGEAVYQAPGGVIDTTNVNADPSNPWFAGAMTFVQTAAGALGLLGHGGDPGYVLQPGIVVTSSGDMQINAPWNFAGWQFNGQPGVLTLRAGGNLLVNASLSDGFTDLNTGPTGFVLPATPWDSWTYQLVAGANLASANLLATLGPWSSTPLGSVIIAPGVVSSGGGGGRGGGGGGGSGEPTMIRTGTGSISIAADGDLDLGNQASVIYTAGTAGPGIVIPGGLVSGGLNSLPYPVNGGDISIDVEGNINGALSSQFYTDWQLRTGQNATTSNNPHATAWTVNFSSFNQGIATLGGGSIDITSGGDITNLNVSTPSTGRQVGGTTVAANEVQVVGGGDLRVRAGGSILGGEYYSDNGVSSLVAEGSIGTAQLPDGTAVAPILALGSGSLEVISRQAGAIETIVNPTLIPVSPSVGAVAGSYFGTYTDSSAVSVIAVGGPLRFMGGTDLGSAVADELAGVYSQAFGVETLFRILPPTIEAASLSDSLQVGGAFSMWAAPRGNLTLFAENSIQLTPVQTSSNYDIVVSDADPVVTQPTPANPTALASIANILGSASGTTAGFNAAIPVHSAAASADGLPDPTPIRLIAATGDIIDQVNAGSEEGQLYFSKPALIAAGGDIENLNVRIQNVDTSSVTSIVAGGNIDYPFQRDIYGNVETAPRGITVDGPGQLEAIAGGTIDLGTSAGIISEGNLRNPALPSTGANINVIAGAAPAAWDTKSFIDDYIVPSGSYDSALVSYVEQMDPLADTATHAAAVAAFMALTPAQQRGFLEEVLFDELRTSGRAAAAAGALHDNFTEGFTALSTLFPGSNPDTSAGQTNPFHGDITLYFSQIYTLSGGTINLLAPGGGVNAGLAVPPTAFGIQKPPSSLGIVAEQAGDVNAVVYGDFEVNASRVFAADGGNILVWSTDGNIDAGRGAKTAISAPPPVITYNQDGTPAVTFPAALTGSGIQTLATTPGVSPGDVDLFAPRGVVNANDAGIVAGNLTIAATAVLGANNITVSGTAVGLPVAAPALGASLSGATATAASTSNSVNSAVGADQSKQNSTPLADQALGWLDVFVMGFGEDVCKSDDMGCLERQRRAPH